MVIFDSDLSWNRNYFNVQLRNTDSIFYNTSHCLFNISGPNEINHKPLTYAL